MEFKHNTCLVRTTTDGKYTIIKGLWDGAYSIKDNDAKDFIKYPSGMVRYFRTLKEAKNFILM